MFNPAFDKAITVANAQGAFRGSGIFPVNAGAIPEHAFAPSATTDRTLAPQSTTLAQSSDTQPGIITPSASANSAAQDLVLPPQPPQQSEVPCSSSDAQPGIITPSASANSAAQDPNQQPFNPMQVTKSQT